MLNVDKIHRSINEYNKYHAPEVTAQLKVNLNNTYCILFTGSFCKTCGFYDYFDDFKFLLSDHGINSTITQVTETEIGSYVHFQLAS